MGAAVGAVLHASGLEVLTWIEGRSTTTHQRTEAANISTVPSLASLIERCDLVLSILAPAHAHALAQMIGDTARGSGTTTPLADCNAIAPRTVAQIETELDGSGITFLDAGIIGGPPRTDYAPRFYVSGPSASVLETLDGRGIEVINVGAVTGRASAVMGVLGQPLAGELGVTLQAGPVAPHLDGQLVIGITVVHRVA